MTEKLESNISKTWGLNQCCLCSPEDHKPTHEGLSVFSYHYWCRNCGNLLTFKQMDNYAASELYKQREKELDSMRNRSK